MSRLDDDILVSALTLPGTHDSAAYKTSWPFVQTQKLNILQQLDEGIRYFDFRCGIRDDIVEMVHGISVLGITLELVLDTMYLWLLAHSSEALIVQIKQDRKAERSTVHFSHAIAQLLDPKSERWRTANTTPTLGELRGKIQLFRRFEGPSLHAYGIDVTQWQDNPIRPFTIYAKEMRITIQDHYSFPDPEPLPDLIVKKGGDVSELLNQAATNQEAGHWYINFTSAFEFNVYYQIPPREIAVGGWWVFKWEDGINLRLRAFLRDHKGKRRFGIVAMDFPESGPNDLITALIRSNSKHERQAPSILRLAVVLILLSLFVVASSYVPGHSGLWCPTLLHACSHVDSTAQSPG